jgi:hypothetical protein
MTERSQGRSTNKTLHAGVRLSAYYEPKKHPSPGSGEQTPKLPTNQRFQLQEEPMAPILKSKDMFVQVNTQCLKILRSDFLVLLCSEAVAHFTREECADASADRFIKNPMASTSAHGKTQWRRCHPQVAPYVYAPGDPQSRMFAYIILRKWKF